MEEAFTPTASALTLHTIQAKNVPIQIASTWGGELPCSANTSSLCFFRGKSHLPFLSGLLTIPASRKQPQGHPHPAPRSSAAFS